MLLDLQLANVSDIHAKDAITESITRLNTISLIHHQLYRNDQTSSIEFSQFATGLYVQLDKLLVKKEQQVTFHNKIAETVLDIDTAVPLGLILNELITNSYKHAFNGANGSITVSIEKEGGNYTVSYTDSGAGLGDDIDLANLDTLGIMIIQSLTKQIGGLFEYTRSNNLFIVTFRDATEMKKIA